MITACVRGVPTSCYCFVATIASRYFTQEVHRCSIACVTCCRLSEGWCRCAFYCSINTCLPDSRRLCIDDCNNLCSCCTLIAACIRGIPTSCYCLAATIASCYFTQEVHRCSITSVTCCRLSEGWCRCTFYCSINSRLPDRRRL